MIQPVIFQFLIFGFGLLFWLLPNQGFTSPYLNTEDPPLIRIYIDQLTPLQIGLKVGRESKALFPDIERRYDAHLATLLTPSLYAKLQREILPKLLQQLEPAYQEELKGVAAAWSLTPTNQLGDGLLSLSEFQLVNLLPDVGLFPDGIGFGVFDKTSVDNTPIIGRNLDWSKSSELRSLHAITVYQSNNTAVVNVGFAGIISILTGFNHHGLFLSYYKAEPYSPYQRTPHLSHDTHSSVFDLRKILETRQSNQQAARYLSEQSYPYRHSILMADKNNIQVLEYHSGGIAKIRRWNSPTKANKQWNKRQQIAVIGCHILANLPNNCRDAKEGYHWMRLRQLAVFNSTNPANTYEITDILLDTKNHLFEIFNAQTLQSMVYQPKNGNLYLYTATVDATLMTETHRAYFDIIPKEIRDQSANKNEQFSLWLITALLLILSAIVYWVVWQDRNSHRK
jgi:hypothetical protein